MRGLHGLYVFRTHHTQSPLTLGKTRKIRKFSITFLANALSMRVPV